MTDSRLSFDTKKRRKPPAWPGAVKLSLQVTLVLGVTALLWLGDHSIAALLAASVSLASWLGLSWLRK